MVIMTTLTARIATFPKTNPFNFNLLVATIKTSAADIVTQSTVEGKNIHEIDWRRNVNMTESCVHLSHDEHPRRPSPCSAAST